MSLFFILHEWILSGQPSYTSMAFNILAFITIHFCLYSEKKINIYIFELGKFQKFGLFEKEYIQTDLDRFNQDIRVVVDIYFLNSRKQKRK